MARLDLLRLRKAAGLSQRELAEKLGVQPSFLSAIENGRSRLPEEKIDRLKDILACDDLEDYMTEDGSEAAVPPHTHSVEESDAITRLLKHIHAEAHKSDSETKSREKDLEDRVDFLSKRNDRLSERVDNLREEVDSLRAENYRLKEALISNGIKF